MIVLVVKVTGGRGPVSLWPTIVLSVFSSSSYFHGKLSCAVRMGGVSKSQNTLRKDKNLHVIV